MTPLSLGDSASDDSTTTSAPLETHVLIIGDYNYKRCRDHAKRYKSFWKNNVPTVENVQLHRVFYNDGCLNDLKKEYEKHKKKNGLPHIVIIVGGNRDIARATNERVVVTKLCRIASRMRKDGVYKVTIGSLFLCGYKEQFDEFNNRVKASNELLTDKINMMSGTYFLPISETESDTRRKIVGSPYDAKNMRYLSRSGNIELEKCIFDFLKDKLVPLIKEMKLDHQKNLKHVIPENTALQMPKTRFIDSESKIENLKLSLAQLEESRRVLLEDKKKLEFVLRTASAKLTKIDTYVSGTKALIDYVQDNTVRL